MSAKRQRPRNRSCNFSKMERMLVAKLCRANPEIDAKEYDKFTLKRKSEAWETVLALYRAEMSKKRSSLPIRDVRQLQGCWKRLKDQTRRKGLDLNELIEKELYNISGEANTSDGNESCNTSDEANESDPVMTNGCSTTADSEPFHMTVDIYENYENGAESSEDNSNCQDQITADKLAENVQQDQVPYNRLLRVKNERIPSNNPGSQNTNDNVIRVINISAADQSSQPAQAPNVPTLQRTSSPADKRGDKSRPYKDLYKDDDPYIQMALKEHRLKMKILQLKEWKLRKECIQTGIGLPPHYQIP